MLNRKTMVAGIIARADNVATGSLVCPEPLCARAGKDSRGTRPVARAWRGRGAGWPAGCSSVRAAPGADSGAFRKRNKQEVAHGHMRIWPYEHMSKWLVCLSRKSPKSRILRSLMDFDDIKSIAATGTLRILFPGSKIAQDFGVFGSKH